MCFPCWRWRTRGLGVPQNGYIRVAVQAAAGTLLALAVCWPPATWDALSLDPVFANPSLVLLLFNMVLLVSIGAGLSAAQISLEVVGGSLVGGACGIALTFITRAANGGTYADTVTKAAAFMCLAGAFMWATTVLRFRLAPLRITFLFLQLVFAIASAASYHQQQRQWEFTLHWYAYAAIGSAVAWITATLVLPRTAGRTVRRSLGKALRSTGAVMTGVAKVMTGELDEGGQLEARSGESSERIGIDGGLYPLLKPVFDAGVAGGSSIQMAFKYLPAARWEWDVYSAQHRLPRPTFRLLITLVRATLSCSMMLCYPVQTGHTHCRLLRRHRDALRQVAHAFDACCDGLAAVLMEGAPVSLALERLTTLEASFSALSREAAFRAAGPGTGGQRPSPDLVALDMALSLMFSACTRLRRAFLLLPEALGRRAPGATAAARWCGT